MEDTNANGDAFPFAKRSRTVHRPLLEPAPCDSAWRPPEERYGTEFWARLIHQPGARFMRESTDPSATVSLSKAKVSGFPVCRADEDWFGLPVPGLETLPSPAEICRGKRRKKSRQSAAERRVLSVCQHLQELRIKQSSLEKLKSLKWGVGEKSGILSRPEAEKSKTDSDAPEMRSFPTFPDLWAEDHRDGFLLHDSPLRSGTGPYCPLCTDKASNSAAITYYQCETSDGRLPVAEPCVGRSVQRLE